MRRPAAPWERAWSKPPGAISWTRALEPLAFAYGVVAAGARVRAARRRRRVPVFVIAVGGLTVGGSGKSSVARWLARGLAGAGGRAAILLRGHGAVGGRRGPITVPDFEGLDLAARVGRYGDDAVAHRRALPSAVAVIVSRDRARGAEAARSAHAARAVVLDDGWEQSRLRWDELWVVLDPHRPVGNGSLVPAGPLRRPAETLAEATRIVHVLEESEERVPSEVERWLDRRAAGVPRLCLRRVLRGLAAPGAPRSVPLEPPGEGRAALLVSGVGAPSRLERFARDRGFRIAGHAAFADHARWTPRELGTALANGARAGAEIALLTEKDEARWPRELESPLPIRVLRDDLEAVGPAADVWTGLRLAVAGSGSIP